MTEKDWKSRMAKYEQELLEMRQASQLLQPKPENAPAKTPFFQGNISQEKNSGQRPSRPQPSSAPLRVRVITDADETPLAGVLVGVDKRTPRGREPLYIRISGEDGYAETLSMPVGEVDTVYDIWIIADSFYREIKNGVICRGEPLELVFRLKPLTES